MDIVGLDLDGVLCNTNIVLEKFLADEFNITPDWSSIDQYHLESMDFMTKEAINAFLAYMDDGSLYEGALPHNYAEHSTKKLRNEGFAIAIITSRSKHLRDQTIGWLNKYEIVHDMVYLVDSMKKYEVINELDIKAFVEDRFDILESVINGHKPLDLGLYMVDHPYNRFNNEYIIRTSDISEAVARIIDFRRWRGFFLNKCQGDIEKFIKEYQDGK